MEKQETKGRNTLVSLFDAGTFAEMGAYVRRNGMQDTYDAVLCGYGAVEGKLVFAFAQDSDRKNGAFDEASAAKIQRLYEQAVRTGAPVVGVFDSAGAVMYDGASALSAYGKLMKCISDASGIIPQIALVGGVCGGMAAVSAQLFDFTVTVKNVSELFVHAPILVGKETGKTDYAAQNGLSALTASDMDGAVAGIRKLIGMLPSDNRDNADETATDDAGRVASIAGLSGTGLVNELTDSGSFTELYAEYGAGVVTGFARMGGTLVGVIASNQEANGGKLTVKGAVKATKFISFCDSFSVPVLTLVDATGIEQTADAAAAGTFAKLATAYLTATCPKVTAVVGKAYGSAFTLLGSRSVGADFALALDDSVISVMDPVTAVAFLQNDRITADKSREEVEAEWAKENASASLAARVGAIDDVVPAEELRARLCAAFYMLSGKTDAMPTRKHPVLPL